MPTSTKTNHLTIKSLHFQGFKSIEDLRVDLEKGLNIVIGKNGSGKSNFLECIFDSLSMIAIEELSPYPYKKGEITMTDGEQHLFRFEFTRALKKTAGLERELPKVVYDKKMFIDDQLAYDNTNDNTNLSFSFKKATVQAQGNLRNIVRLTGYDSSLPIYIMFAMPNETAFTETPGTITIPFDLNNLWGIPRSLNFINTLLLGIQFFSDLSTLIAAQKTISKGKLLEYLHLDDVMVENLSKYSPIQDFRFNEGFTIHHDDNHLVIDNLKFEFKINANWLPWSQLSDGTKRLFCIIAEISNKKDGVVLVEEPELGVHPHQFNLLMTFLKEQAETKQIIITTHSPKALDILNESELENILLVSYTKKLGTQIDHLSAAQKKKASRYMKEVGFLSDYWLMSNLEND